MDQSICFINMGSYAYFTNDAEEAGSGASRQIYLLSTELAKSVDTHVIVGNYGQQNTEQYEGVKLHKCYSVHNTSGQLNQFKKVKKLAQTMATVDADWFVFRGSPRHAFISYFLSTLLNKNWIYHFAHDGDVHTKRKLESPLKEKLFLYCLSRADAVICQNEYQKTVLRQNTSINPILIPNGYRPATSYPPYDERQYFLWVGRLTSHKNPDIFLDLAESFPDIPFWVIGEAETTSEYINMVKSKMEETPNVRYIGAVPPHDIHEYYKNAIALIATSSREGFPNVFLEAWRVGTPTIGLHVDPNQFLNTEYEMYADGQISKATKICHRLRNELTWTMMSEETKRTFEEKYDIQRSAEQYLNVIN